MGLFRRATPQDPAEIERVRAELAALRAAIDAKPDHAPAVNGNGDGQHEPVPDPRVDELAARLDALDQRVTSVSTELANQLTELGRDIDALGDRPPSDGDEAVLGELRDGQVRLANEQARYQIAFREDLARLAEHVGRRP